MESEPLDRYGKGTPAVPKLPVLNLTHECDAHPSACTLTARNGLANARIAKRTPYDTELEVDFKETRKMLD